MMGLSPEPSEDAPEPASAHSPCPRHERRSAIGLVDYLISRITLSAAYLSNSSGFGGLHGPQQVEIAICQYYVLYFNHLV